MMNADILVWIYVGIGILFSIYHFQVKYGENYQIAKRYGQVDDSFVILYMLGVALLWPIVIVKDWFSK